MDKSTIFKGTIAEFNHRNTEEDSYMIMFRIINFNDLFFFAEEISTECIFPIYSISETSFDEEEDYNPYGFNCHNSYLENGKYYVQLPLKMKSDELFKYEIDESKIGTEYNRLAIATNDEVSRYLQTHKESSHRRKLYKKMEASNKYMCDLSIIKEKILMTKNNEEEKYLIDGELKAQYVKYKPPLDLKEIEEFGYDLSTQDTLCDLIGREEELKKIIKTVAINNKSVLLLGDPGVGKTSIVEKLALDIKEGKSKFLEGKIIFCLNTASLTAGTRYRGDFEEKLKDFLDFCQEHKDKIIVFIDEIHTLYGLGASTESPMDAMNILKPYISKGDITIIGATTIAEFEKHMSKDPAFLRRFENTEIPHLPKEMTIKILLAHIESLEKKHKIKINLSEEEILKIVEHIFEITDGKYAYIAGNIKIENPTLAKNILENIFAEAVYNEKENVTEEDINIAIKEYEKISLEFISDFGYDLSMQDTLCDLIGREKELEQIIKTIAIEGNSVLLVGEPGTGKTSIVEKIALDIKNGNNKYLQGKKIFALNTASLTAGTKYRGEFEEKINKLINSCRKNKDKVILFIDEIHTLFGLGKSADSSIDAMNILKPYLSSGDITLIGATTKKEFEKYMVHDPAFVRRLKIIDINPLEEEEQTNILFSYVTQLEKKYQVEINKTEIPLLPLMKYIAEITELKYQNIKENIQVENPTISKRLIAEAFSDAVFHGQKTVTLHNIISAIMNCNQLPISFRKICAETLEEYVQTNEKESEPDIVGYARKRHKLNTPSKVGFV